MSPEAVQQVFFNHIRSILPHHLSIVDEVASLLDISNDSAYRRMRGDKPLTFEEVQKLCVHFNISLDSIFHLDTDTYIFSGKFLNKRSAISSFEMGDFHHPILPFPYRLRH